MSAMDDLVTEVLQCLKDGDTFTVHVCGVCGYLCGFVWQNGQVCYDEGCRCVGRRPPTPRSIDRLRDAIQRHPRYAEAFVERVL